MSAGNPAERGGSDRVNFEHARTGEQTEIMRRAEELGQCTFCPPFIEEDPNREIIQEGEYWLVTPNAFPYENTQIHLLFVPRRHIEHFTELAEEEGHELVELLQWACSHYDLDYGAVGLRFGDMKGTGASLSHLHVHLIVAERDLEVGDKRVRFPMGPKPPSE